MGPARWRIVNAAGEDLVPRFQSEELARKRWFTLSRSRATDRGAKLLAPDGSVVDEI
jgi:hypothetical protein